MHELAGAGVANKLTILCMDMLPLLTRVVGCQYYILVDIHYYSIAYDRPDFTALTKFFLPTVVASPS